MKKLRIPFSSEILRELSRKFWKDRTSTVEW